MSRTSFTVALIAAATLLVGCRDDGRTLDPAPTVPVSRQTTTTAGPPADPAVGTEGGALTLTSPAFADGGPLPEDHTCDGLDVPPPLVIDDVPAGVVELAVVVTERADAGAVHWVLAGIPSVVTRLDSGVVPPEAVPARSSTGVEGWDGPCPPPGDAARIYDFLVYAMTEPIGLTPGLDARRAIELIEQAAVATGALSATYASPAEG